MRPTLFAPTTKEMWPRHRDAMNRILPTRCTPAGFTHFDSCVCSGRGFLYPPMPEWWEARATKWTDTPKSDWHEHCDDTYRAMGILEGDD